MKGKVKIFLATLAVSTFFAGAITASAINPGYGFESGVVIPISGDNQEIIYNGDVIGTMSYWSEYDILAGQNKHTVNYELQEIDDIYYYSTIHPKFEIVTDDPDTTEYYGVDLGTLMKPVNGKNVTIWFYDQDIVDGDGNQYNVVSIDDLSVFGLVQNSGDINRFNYQSSADTTEYYEPTTDSWNQVTKVDTEFKVNPKWFSNNFLTYYQDGIVNTGYTRDANGDLVEVTYVPKTANPVWKYEYSNVGGNKETNAANNQLSVDGETVIFRTKVELGDKVVVDPTTTIINPSIDRIHKAKLVASADNAFAVSFNSPFETFENISHEDKYVFESFARGYNPDLFDNSTAQPTITDLVDALDQINGKTEINVYSQDWKDGPQVYEDGELLAKLKESFNESTPVEPEFYVYFVVSNETYKKGDLPNQHDGTYFSNPAALIYQLSIEGNQLGDGDVIEELDAAADDIVVTP